MDEFSRKKSFNTQPLIGFPKICSPHDSENWNIGIIFGWTFQDFVPNRTTYRTVQIHTDETAVHDSELKSPISYFLRRVGLYRFLNMNVNFGTFEIIPPPNLRSSLLDDVILIIWIIWWCLTKGFHLTLLERNLIPEFLWFWKWRNV